MMRNSINTGVFPPTVSMTNKLTNSGKSYYTIRPEELSDWFISLEKRGIELPDVLKQELN